MSIKAMPMSLVMEGSSGKSYLINVIDCPGGWVGGGLSVARTAAAAAAATSEPA
jgi:translation elongation factor EF-4